jgi:transposase InsO family protein
MDDDRIDPQLRKALCRYEAISAYVAARPKRGQKKEMLEQLAARPWQDEHGEPLKVEAETLRSWARRYRKQGLAGLMDQPRSVQAVSALSPEQVALVCSLKREVPERSLDRIIEIAEGMKLVEPGVVRRSTLHRVLRRAGLSQRACRTPDSHDLDRFEAAFPSDLWQSDMLVGPWLPDPARPGKMRRAYLYAFLDDHSRLLLHGRFSFKGDLPALELVFRRCLQKWGIPRRVYYDNGQTYRSNHMRQIVATIGIHRLVFTQPHRPMGHGKIEALNHFIRSAFLAELSASPRLTALDAINEAFLAWADTEYNRRVHSETGQAPLERWRAGADQVRYADEELLRQAFLFHDHRTPDKAGVFSLLGRRYQTSAQLARRRVEVRYDPEALDEIEVWLDNHFVERVRPLDIEPHRRPRDPALKDAPAAAATAAPTADWLSHLVERRRCDGFVEPPPRTLDAERARARREADEAVVSILKEHLDPAVVDEDLARSHLDRFGPFDPDRTRAALEQLLSAGLPRDCHVAVVLERIRAELHSGGAS